MKTNLMATNYSKFGEILGELICDKKIDVPTLSSALNVSKNTIYQYISNKRLPTYIIALDFADYFNCSLDFLFGLSDNFTTVLSKNRQSFSERFLFLLKYFGKTEYRLTKEMKISRASIYYWKIGENQPSVDSLIKLAAYFDCSLDFIAGRTN